MGDLTNKTTPLRVSAGRYRLEVEDGWQQGRGCFGGVVMAALERAMEDHSATPERTLRSLTGSICGPVQVGEAAIEVEVLRAGTGMSTLSSKLVQHGEVQAHAVAVLGKDRTANLAWNTLVPPAMSDWREVPVAPLGPPIGPTFTQHFEVRPTGPIPWTGGEDPLAEGWVRARNPGVRRDAGYVIALVDVWWPALMACLTAPRPIATVAFTLQMVNGLDGLDLDAPLRYRARTDVVGGGFATEFRELWGHDGRLVALNQQSIAIIR